MSESIECKISQSEIINMGSSIPSAVQLRLRLNREGFKFEDDGQMSVIINESPEALGTMSSWEDYQTGCIHYRQVITHEQSSKD